MKRSITESLEEIARDYSARVAKHGAVAQATGWSDQTSQVLRFQQLYAIIDDDEAPFSLADIGSGYGAFYLTLPKQLRDKVSQYTGYDISEDMILEGRKLLQERPEAKFVHGNAITDKADYVIASGIFNHHFDANKDEWGDHIRSTIKHMYESANKGIAFNIMSNQVDYQEDYLHYQDPAEMLSFCMETFGRHVTLVHDYPLYEFTMLVGRP